MESSVDMERSADFEAAIIREAIEIGADRLRCVLMSTANWMMIAAAQIDSSHSYPDAGEKESGRKLAELVLESLASELPTRPMDLLSEVDPDDFVRDDERFTQSVHSRLVEIIKGVRL